MKKKFLCLLLSVIAFSMCFGQSIDEEWKNENMVIIPGMNINMLKTEVTQGLYESVMGINPSYFCSGNEYYEKENGESFDLPEGWDEKNLPVETVNWYDAMTFCNKLSEMLGLAPVYSINGISDVTQWDYIPHKSYTTRGEITQKKEANGFRLPTEEEWIYAAKGGQTYKYAGSDDLDEIGWFENNSDGKPHPVAQKKPNGYGLYDMSGNLWEWIYEPGNNDSLRSIYSGVYDGRDYRCKVGYKSSTPSFQYDKRIGFRVVCASSK